MTNQNQAFENDAPGRGGACRCKALYLFLAVFSLLALPELAYAQATLTGVVRDTSGGVLPGVTVEASSPVLIEKVRSTTTDDTGQYRIIDLRPGTYTIKYILSGFSVVERAAVQVSGGGTITFDAELKPGVSETVTVTSESPVVEVQSTRRQQVIDGETINTIPVARGYGNLLAAVPGISLAGAGGLTSSTGLAPSFFTSNGGANNEGRIQIAGMNVGSSFNGGGVAAFAYDVSNTQEIQVTVSGGLGEADTGGPAMNLIPREGGNNFSGSVFGSTAGEWSQGDNIDDELRGFGITEPAALVSSWDTSFAMGGPVLRDRLWFFGNIRSLGTVSKIANGRANLNAGNAARWDYAPDDGVTLRSADDKKQVAIRLTGQVTPRNKVGFYFDYNWACTGSALALDASGKGACRQRGDDWVALGSQTQSPESATGWDDREKVIQATWSSPATNRLLLEAGYSTFISRWGGQDPAGALVDFIPVTEQSSVYGFANTTYRGLDARFGNEQMPNTWRGSASYVTGSHNLKVGTQGAYHIHHNYNFTGTNQLRYQFNSCILNPGVPAGTPCVVGQNAAFQLTPNQFTISIPNAQSNRTTFQAYYAQDQWTLKRLTVNGALRYEWAKSWSPEGENGVLEANRFTAAILDPRTDSVTGYHDLSPRVGAAYDVFGNGKTAVRVNLGHYLSSANNEGNFIINSPATTRQLTASRAWTDSNGNFVPDCDPLNFAAQTVPGGDVCNAVTGNSLNFGSTVRTTNVNPDVLSGWGKRPYDWVFGASVQQELIPRLSVELAYSRRWWGNFFVTDNLNLEPANFDNLTIAAPANPNLPDGGGYPVTFRLVNVNQPLNGYYTFAEDYGKETRKYDNVDVTARARTTWGLTLQGGTTTGRGVRDNCEIVARLPELAPTAQIDACAVTERWLTTLRGLATYTVPKIDVLVSAIMRSQPGTTASGTSGSSGAALSANYNVPNATVIALRGTPIVGNAANVSVNLLDPGQLYQDRVNSFDMRFAKILRVRGTRADIGIDLYNVLNANTATAYNQAFGNDGATWLRPTAIQNPRFVRFNVRLDF